MNIVIVGYNEMLRALILGLLASDSKIVGVFRHENVIYSPIKKFFYDLFNPSTDLNFVKAYKLYDIKAKSVNSDEFRKEIKRLKADIIIVGSWSEKFSVQTINTPKIACINVHPSMLPKYRGPNPYLQVILNNEKKTGITFHLMDVNYDTGSILHQKEVKVLPLDNGQTLKLRCCKTAQKEVCVLLKNFKEKFLNSVSQNESMSSYQPKIELKDCILDFKNETSEQILRRIRAFSPWLKCFIPYNNQFFSFEKYKILSKAGKNISGQIVSKRKNSIYIVCKDNKVIRFSNLKMIIPLSKFITKFYLKNFVKINSIAE